MISDDFGSVPGELKPRQKGIFFGGNTKCPTFTWTAFTDGASHEERSRVPVNYKISCYHETIHHFGG
jgi:hypothetical protein